MYINVTLHLKINRRTENDSEIIIRFHIIFTHYEIVPSMFVIVNMCKIVFCERRYRKVRVTARIHKNIK